MTPNEWLKKKHRGFEVYESRPDVICFRMSILVGNEELCVIREVPYIEFEQHYCDFRWLIALRLVKMRKEIRQYRDAYMSRVTISTK